MEEIVDGFARGDRVVVLDAPPGAGKTLVAYMAAQRLAGGDQGDELVDDDRADPHKTLYICTGKGLQDQVARDFTDAAVIKGKANYTPAGAPEAVEGVEPVTCADCDMRRVGGRMVCTWCELPYDCPYRAAKRVAVANPLTVVNTAYALREWSIPGSQLSGRQLVVADECDTLEAQLQGRCDFKVGARLLKQLDLEAPRKGVHQPTIRRWMADELMPAVRAKIDEEKAQAGLWGLSLDQARRVRALNDLVDEIRVTSERMDRGQWVRDDKPNWRGDYDTLTMKPVLVAEHGPRVLWRHGQRWLLMSGTVLSADMMLRELGLPDGWSWSVVTVPPSFPKENRRINYAGVGRLTKKTEAAVKPKVLDAVVQLVRNHPGERVLVHSVSYDLTTSIVNVLKTRTDRTVITYANAKDRERMVELFREIDGAVLVAPSLQRGVDFPGDECRVCVVAKVPYPYLGDRRIDARFRAPGGAQWYAIEAIRELVQATQRGVRGPDDECVMYVVDSAFRGLVERWGHLFPKWWLDAVDWRFNKREAGINA